MTGRKLTLHRQTRLVVNVIIEDDTGALTFSLLVVTRLFTLLWKVSRFVAAVRYETSMLAREMKAALVFTAKVLLIAFSALLFGLGVKL
jgi:hypothetical protein